MCLQRRDQALVGQQRRVDAAGQIPQVVERSVQAVSHYWRELPDGGRVVGGFLQQPELDRERDELLLRPVVQVPFDLPPLGVLGFHQPAAGRPQLVDQCGVAQDKPRLRRQVPQQLVLGAGQRLILWFLQGQRAE